MRCINRALLEHHQRVGCKEVLEDFGNGSVRRKEKGHVALRDATPELRGAQDRENVKEGNMEGKEDTTDAIEQLEEKRRIRTEDGRLKTQVVLGAGHERISKNRVRGGVNGVKGKEQERTENEEIRNNGATGGVDDLDGKGGERTEERAFVELEAGEARRKGKTTGAVQNAVIRDGSSNGTRSAATTRGLRVFNQLGDGVPDWVSWAAVVYVFLMVFWLVMTWRRPRVMSGVFRGLEEGAPSGGLRGVRGLENGRRASGGFGVSEEGPRVREESGNARERLCYANENECRVVEVLREGTKAAVAEGSGPIPDEETRDMLAMQAWFRWFLISRASADSQEQKER
jgi:hypothetical protein